MTICKQCKQKIKGKTSYYKTKALCKDCFRRKKQRTYGRNLTREDYIKWLEGKL